MSIREQIAAKNAKIVKLQAEVAELTLRADTEIDPSLVVVGATVDVVFGRAEKKRSLTGVVLARKSQDKGPDLIRVQVGEGFEAEIVTAYVSNVTGVAGAASAE